MCYLSKLKRHFHGLYVFSQAFFLGESQMHLILSAPIGLSLHLRHFMVFTTLNQWLKFSNIHQMKCELGHFQVFLFFFIEFSSFDHTLLYFSLAFEFR